MDIEYDEKKNEQNIKRRGLPFSFVMNFIWETAYIVKDVRHTLENRFKVTGYIDEKLYTIIITFRGDKIRVISLRDASRAERRDYATQFSIN